MKHKSYNVIIGLARAEDAEGSFSRSYREVVRDVRARISGLRYYVTSASGAVQDAQALAADEAIALRGVPVVQRLHRRVVVKPHVIEIVQAGAGELGRQRAETRVITAEELTSSGVRVATTRRRGVARERVRNTA